jgi:hypothetical protein
VRGRCLGLRFCRLLRLGLAEKLSRVLAGDGVEELFADHCPQADGAAALFELGVLDDIKVGAEEDTAANFRVREERLEQVDVFVVGVKRVADVGPEAGYSPERTMSRILASQLLLAGSVAECQGLSR